MKELQNQQKQTLDQIKKKIKLNQKINFDEDIKKQELLKQHQSNQNNKIEISEESKRLLEGIKKKFNKRTG